MPHNVSAIASSTVSRSPEFSGDCFKPVILNIQDDDSARKATNDHLESAGFLVIACEADDDPVDLVLQHRPHLAVIRLASSAEDGCDTCRRIRSHPQTAPLSIIRLSTSLPVDHMPGRLAGGADVYLADSSGPEALVATIRSILQLHLANRIAREAEHKLVDARALMDPHNDELTGLPDRTAFGMSLAKAMSSTMMNAGWLALFFLDLDGFKLMSRGCGGRDGDEILARTADRLREFSGTGDCLARVGGDEFAMFIAGDGREPSVHELASELLQTFDDAFDVFGTEVFITATVGVGVYPRDGETSAQLLHSAETAMYQARRQGKNRWQRFTPEMAATARDRDTLERHLRNAIASDQLSLRYQPQIALENQRVVRYEARLHWDHPKLGSVSRNRFIPVAEESGLIVSIGRWVLNRACRDALSFPQEEAQVAVKVSANQLMRPDFFATIKEAVQSAALSPRLLHLELIDLAPIEPSMEIACVLRQLRDLGITLGIDNFGTGHTSLRTLSKLPLNILKFDEAFARRLGIDREAATVLRAMISLADSFGLTSVIDGIDTADQLTALSEIECDQVQGLAVGPPMMVESLKHAPATAGVGV